MKDLFVVAGMCALAIIVGGLLLLFGPEMLNGNRDGSVAFIEIASGSMARDIDTRKNYRVTDEEQFSALWTMIHGAEPPARPAVDFATHEVLATFDGSHSSSGYDISVEKIEDAHLTRVVHITHEEPHDTCMVATGQTSPYTLVVVPKLSGDAMLTHIDTTVTTECS